MRRFAGALLLAGSLALCHAAGNPLELASVLTAALPSTALGTSTATVDRTGFRGDATAAVGYAASDNSVALELEASVNAATMAELPLAVACLRLIDSSNLPQLDEAIPTRLLPGGLSFANPSYPGRPFTLRMLLTHTSTLRDQTRFDQSPLTEPSGTATVAITDFATQYFLTTAGGTTAVRTDIFATAVAPGTGAAYTYARSNTALLTFIMQAVVAGTPTLVAGGQKTAAAYMQETVLAPLGMTGSYFLLPDGSVPLTATALQTLSGGRVAAPAPVTNVAAYASGGMFYTTTADLAKLAYALFVATTGTFVTTGAALRAGLMTLSAADSARSGVTKLGFGLVEVSSASACTAWAASGSAALSCPFDSSRPLFGAVAADLRSLSGVLCTTDPASAVTAAPGVSVTSCVSSVTPMRASAVLPFTHAYAAVGESFKQLYSTVAGASSISVVTMDTQEEGAWYAVSIVFIVLAIILGIVALTLVVEFLIPPLAIAGAVVGDAYPKLEGMDRPH